MADTTNLNIRIDRQVKEQADYLLNEFGLNMTTAINMFLRTVIREQRIPFELKMDVPNAKTIEAIEEGRKIARDPNAKGYHSMDELKAALDL
ncbi:type II toxin-antitoxin system RelB/DinJ family antitoxin [Dialister sp.]|uniref:type II toxin-antitoxin system RelB/DinJ family antitoxin n=1 Tax=Dialister sp. TaxID=1955814 RepID=UPI002E81E317|nr:type II toxin-antitoxin system RelB/DinJ family antitoxin [Dialister sp.]MEE3452775.1 type II toxin-antitoxin system RelB/DinJ family antitoxin [Dialister sp.]